MATTATMAGAQFDALPYEEGRKWELFDGELIEVPSTTPEHQMIVSNLMDSLRAYLRERPVGVALPDSEFALGPDDRARPDGFVLLHERWRGLDFRRTPIPGAPDIAIEVISPSERTADSTRKVSVYLRAGVEEVWQVYSTSSTVVIYTANDPVRVIQGSDILSSRLLPGWQMELRDIFAL